MKMLTIKTIEAEVKRIREMAGDDEATHVTEDDLHQSTLRAIADGKCENPRECARAALKTQEISFARWCA